MFGSLLSPSERWRHHGRGLGDYIQGPRCAASSASDVSLQPHLRFVSLHFFLCHRICLAHFLSFFFLFSKSFFLFISSSKYAFFSLSPFLLFKPRAWLPTIAVCWVILSLGYFPLCISQRLLNIKPSDPPGWSTSLFLRAKYKKGNVSFIRGLNIHQTRVTHWTWPGARWMVQRVTLPLGAMLECLSNGDTFAVLLKPFCAWICSRKWGWL